MGDSDPAVRRVSRRRRRARSATHVLRRRRREAIDLFLPGRRAENVLFDAARTGKAAPRGRARFRLGSPGAVVPLRAARARRRRSRVRSRGGLARPDRGRRKASAAWRVPRRSQGHDRIVGADRGGEVRRARGLAHAARRERARRSAGGAGAPHRRGHQGLALAGFAGARARRRHARSRAGSPPATS